MSICFKWCFPVDLIRADSCMKRTELCISVDIWYEFHGQTSSFLANMWFPWPHISSHCALNYTVICHCSHSEISEGAFSHYSFTHCCSSCVFCKIQTADWWNYTSLKFTWIFCVMLLFYHYRLLLELSVRQIGLWFKWLCLQCLSVMNEDMKLIGLCYRFTRHLTVSGLTIEQKLLLLCHWSSSEGFSYSVMRKKLVVHWFILF